MARWTWLVARTTVGESAGSRIPGSQGSSWVSGLFGKSKVMRGQVVSGRLGAYVAPVVEVERQDAQDLEWVREHNAKFRSTMRGADGLIQRLNDDSDEAEQERLPERPVKGEAFMVKMLEQRMRRKQEA